MKKLYFYSTTSWYENRIKLNKIPFLKIGHTETQTVLDRIGQQDTTSNPEPLICMGEFDVDFEDTDFHLFLEEQGYKRSREDKDREFFDITVEKAEYELERFKKENSKEVSKTLNELKLYKHQSEFVDKILNSWKVWNNSLDFLLFAKCRSGKSVMVLSAINKFDEAKVSVVLSRFNSPKQSWIDDCRNFSSFSNIIPIDTQEKGWEGQYDLWSKTDKKILLVGTIQGFKKLKNLPIDLIVYDEAHIGYDASDWKCVRKTIECPVIYVSGTASKLQDDFVESTKYVYTYFEEQRDKKLDIRPDAPSVNVMYRTYDTSGGREIFGQKPDALQNIFNVDEQGNFIDQNAVQDFVLSEFGRQRNIQPNQRLLKNSNHIFLTINSVPAAHAIESVFSSTRFAPLVVTGDTNENQKSIETHIKNNPSGTVIITKLANVLGLTVKEIDTVINFSEGKSLEVWTQVMFRGGSSSKDWIYIDYAPERCLLSLRELYFSACDRNPDIAEFKLTDYFPIAEWMDGEKELNEELVNKILSSDPSNAIKLMARTPVGNEKILDEIDFNNLKLEPTDSSIVRNINLFSNESQGKSNKIKKRNPKDIENTKSYKEKTVKAIKERLPLVIFREIKDGNNSCNIYSLIKSKHYSFDTGDNMNILHKCLELGYENERVLNRRISQLFIDIAYSMSQDISKTLDKLSISRESQQQIPLELLDEMLTDVSINGKMLIISDPSGLHSQRLIEKGCTPENIVVWENDICHTYAIKQVDDKINVVNDLNSLHSMHFTESISNPPYKGQLHLEFLLKQLRISDNVKQVHPSGWLTRSSKSIEFEVKKELKGRVKKLTIFNGLPVFNAEFVAPLVITEAVKEHKGKIEVYYQNTGNTYYIDSLDDFPSGYWEPTEVNLLLRDKINIEASKSNVLSLRTSDYNKVPLNLPVVCGDPRSKNPEDLFRVDFYIFYYPNSDLCSTNNSEGKFYSLNSVEERDSLLSYLKTKYARFALALNKSGTRNNVSRYIKNIPLPPLDRQWSDSTIVEHYNLTQDEWESIDSFIPDYYG